MAANIDPIYPKTPMQSWSTLTAVNNVYDGTGTVGTIATIGADGSWVSYIKLKPLGTNVPSVARIWINNGLTNATAANNYLFTEVTLPTTTAVANAALTEIIIPVNFGMRSGYKFNWALGTAVAAGWQAAVFWGDY